jgi:hypothetical protein
MMKNIFLIFIITIFLVGFIQFTSAALPNFKQNDCGQIITNLNATAVNITGIVSPDSQIVSISNPTMQKTGNFFNYTFCPTQLGTYTYGYCDDAGNCYNNDFKVTISGLNELTQSESTIYILIFTALLLIFVGLLIAGIKLPSYDNSDEMTGYIIAVNNMKYVKIFCIAMSYVVLIIITFFVYNFSYAYLNINFIADIFRIFFYILLAALLPLFIVGTYVVIANLTRDKQTREALKRGFNVKE